jgi:hypothetical protein
MENTSLKVNSLPKLLRLQQSEIATIIPVLTRMNTLMGGGNDREALLAYADAVRELWPTMTMEHFESALRHGLAHVRWFGKLTIPAIAEFLRDYKHPKPMTKDEAHARLDEIRAANRIEPGGFVPVQLMPKEVREIIWT